MSEFDFFFDLHTHSGASGHGSFDTVSDMAKRAAALGLACLGISEHGPATPGSARESYFRGLRLCDRSRFGISLLFGAELNISDRAGTVDLPDEITASLDYCFISMHPKTFRNLGTEGNTEAMINAMSHPGVRFLGHPDDAAYLLDYEVLLPAARDRKVFPEINNASLMPDSYRKDCHENCRRILEICRKLDYPVLLSSDSHGKAHIADFQYCLELLRETDFPADLILNCRPCFTEYLQRRRGR